MRITLTDLVARMTYRMFLGSATNQVQNNQSAVVVLSNINQVQITETQTIRNKNYDLLLEMVGKENEIGRYLVNK